MCALASSMPGTGWFFQIALMLFLTGVILTLNYRINELKPHWPRLGASAMQRNHSLADRTAETAGWPPYPMSPADQEAKDGRMKCLTVKEIAKPRLESLQLILSEAM